MSVLEELSSGAVTRAELEDLGVRDAGLWEKLSATYFGATRHPAPQAAAREAAEGLSLDAVAVIEKHLRRLLEGAAVEVAELRVELCGLRGTVPEIDRAAAARVRELNRVVQDAAKKSYGRRALRGGKNTDALGMRTITLTLPERQMSTVISTLLVTAGPLRTDDPKLSWEQAMADAAFRHLTGAGGGAQTVIDTLAVMRTPDYVTFLRHEGDETIFGLTDGTTITGAELVTQELAVRHGYVAIFDPVAGPLNAYRDERFANAKQRMLLAAETLVCPYPGCTTAADHCQVHHLTAWRNGGQTNIAEMTIACRVHNARNDDDADAPPRHGRLERRPGGVVHLPPDGGPPRTNRHPVRQLSAAALIS